MSPEHNKLSYKFKILPTGTPAILAPRRIRIRERPDLTNLCSAFHTMKIVASWTSRSLNKQNSNSILSYITECFTHANSCIFCYTKRKRTKNLHSRNCLSKISLGTHPYSLLGGEGGGNLGGFRLCYSKIYLVPPLWSNVSLWSSLIDS